MYRIAFSRLALAGKLPQGDPRWAELNDSFVNQELDTIDIANAIYTGHAFAAWHTGRRKHENFQLAQHIGVDMDAGGINTAMAHPLTGMYASMVYSTPSSTPQAPRCRILFLLDSPITVPSRYTTAARFLTSMYQDADEACAEPSRFFYGSMNCELEYLGHELPLRDLRILYHQWTQGNPAQAQTQRMAQPGDGIVNLAEHRAKRLAANLPDELVKAQDALRRIDPWSVDYNRWIGIIAALKRDFGDQALPLAEQWAQGKPGEVAREWARLKMDASGMHVGTIHYLAGRT